MQPAPDELDLRQQGTLLSGRAGAGFEFAPDGRVGDVVRVHDVLQRDPQFGPAGAECAGLGDVGVRRQPVRDQPVQDGGELALDAAQVLGGRHPGIPRNLPADLRGHLPGERPQAAPQVGQDRREHGSIPHGDSSRGS